MKKILLVIFILVQTGVFAGTPDSAAVVKLYNTSWTLEKIDQYQGYKKKKIIPAVPSRITFYSDEIHTEGDGQPYQVCFFSLKNQNEFWLDCKENDQMIYKIIRFDSAELVIDVLVKDFKTGTYFRTMRKYYSKSSQSGFSK